MLSVPVVILNKAFFQPLPQGIVQVSKGKIHACSRNSYPFTKIRLARLCTKLGEVDCSFVVFLVSKVIPNHNPASPFRVIGKLNGNVMMLLPRYCKPRAGIP